MASLAEISLVFRRKIKELYEMSIGKFIKSIFKKKSSIIFLGIDNSGKTTLVNKLKYNVNHVFMPTKHATETVVEVGNLTARVLDVGGHEAARLAWKDHLCNVDGIVFMVDVADKDPRRIEELREAWKAVLELSGGLPILVFMNKIDRFEETSQSIKRNDALRSHLEETAGIHNSTVGQPVRVEYTSVVYENICDKDSGLCAGFTWLAAQIEERRG